jgi:hypothetical protein
MPTIAEQFLETEQAASALLDELTQLKAQTRHYSAAAGALDDASRSLSEVAAHAAELVTTTRDVVVSMREIGTPQLLEKLVWLSARYEEQQGQLQEMHSAVQSVTDGVASISSTLDTVSQRLEASMNSVGSKLETVMAATERLLERRPWWAFWRPQ